MDADLEDLCAKMPCCKGKACASAGGACASPAHSAFPEDLKQHVKVPHLSLCLTLVLHQMQLSTEG